MKRIPFLLLLAATVLLRAAGGQPLALVGGVPGASYVEPWRPRFHFTPARNWMNDPNGMVYYDGEYHLFYQYNPHGDRWGHMSWGHAVSRDLVHWQHLPLALAEEDGVMIFSGSAVVDWSNTSGFGDGRRPPLVAIYTGHHTGKPLQNQYVAYSNDRGRTWTKHAGNPVLDIGAKDFRDPKVFWHEGTGQWVMVIAWPVERKVRFYGSPDLKAWTHLDDFGPAGSTQGIWECPDLLPIPVEGRRGTTVGRKWLLIVNVGSGTPAGGSGCQYFVGDFDGKRFVPEPGPANGVPGAGRWADHGPDFYAAVSWSGIPRGDGRRLWLGWMSNWEYAQEVPTSPWRSAMTVPRELRLRSDGALHRLVQLPVDELKKLRGKRLQMIGQSAPDASSWLRRRAPDQECQELEVDFDAALLGGEFGLRLRLSEGQEITFLGDLGRGTVRVDRTRSGRVDFHPRFPGTYEAPLRVRDGAVRWRILVDTSSVELFANDGESVVSCLVFPDPGPRRWEVVHAGSATAKVCRELTVWGLKSAWK